MNEHTETQSTEQGAETPAEDTSAATDVAQTDAAVGDQAAAAQESPSDAGDADEQSAEGGDENESKAAEEQPFQVTIDMEDEAFKDVDVDQDQLNGFTGKMTELEKALAEAGGDREKVREIISAHANDLAKFEAQRQKDSIAALQKTVDGWKAEAQADPDIGGAAYDENMGKVAQVRDRFGSEDLQYLLDETGMGSHPVWLKFALSISEAMSESTLTGGRQGATQERSLADRIYG